MDKNLDDKIRKENESLWLYLKSSFEDSMNVDVVPTDIMCDYDVVGTFNGHKVSFQYDEELGKLILSSTDPNWDMSELISCLNIFMDGVGPICRYDVIDSVKDRFCKRIIEWNEDFDKRFSELQYNNVYFYPLERKNFYSFIESKEKRDARLGFSVLHPIFFPDFDDSFLESLKFKVEEEYNEQDSFLALEVLNSIDYQRWSNTWSGVDIDPSSVSSAKNIILDKIVSMVGKDNVSEWYSKWQDYFTYDKKCEYMEARISGEDVSMFTCDQQIKKVLSLNNNEN